MKKIVILLACVFFSALIFGCDPNGPDQGDSSCDPPIPSDFTGIKQPPTGPYKVSVEQDPGLMDYTIYRPVTSNAKMPVIAWGNGGCLQSALLHGEFLMELASHGFLIIADGEPTTELGCSQVTMSNQNGERLVDAIDWAFAVNKKSCSQYYQKIDTTKVAAMGQSCGGLMTLNISGDPRLTTIVIWNSGLFARNQQVYNNLHTPVLFITGGQNDPAFANAQADFAAITKVPVFWGDLPVGHGGTYNEDNGGEFGRVGVAWLKWQLLGATGPGGAGMFVGDTCGLCNTEWTIKKKNME
jgi:hypothetical protein